MIKGIDSQIITSKTTEYMKENSARLKGDEFNHVLYSKQEQNQVRKEIQTVTETKKSEHRKVDDEDESKKGQQQEQQKKDEEPVADEVIRGGKVGKEMNAYSGNEIVGFTKMSKLDIEV